MANLKCIAQLKRSLCSWGPHMRSPVRPGQLGFAAQYRWEIPRGAGLQARCCARLCLGLHARKNVCQISSLQLPWLFLGMHAQMGI